MNILDLDDPRAAMVVPAVFTPEEVEAAEEQFPALSAEQPANCCHLFDTAASVKRMRLNAAALEGVRKEFQVIALWHRARGRVEVARQYERRASIVSLVA